MTTKETISVLCHGGIIFHICYPNNLPIPRGLLVELAGNGLHMCRWPICGAFGYKINCQRRVWYTHVRIDHHFDPNKPSFNALKLACPSCALEAIVCFPNPNGSLIRQQEDWRTTCLCPICGTPLYSHLIKISPVPYVFSHVDES